MKKWFWHIIGLMEEVLDNNVSQMRKDKNVTQEEFANHIGVTRQTVIAIEKGNYKPSLLLALKIAKFFKVKVEDIFYIK